MISSYFGPDSIEKQKGEPPGVRTTAIGRPLTIQHDPPRNGVLSSDPWQKIRKTAANGTIEENSGVFTVWAVAFDRRVQTTSFAQGNGAMRTRIITTLKTHPLLPQYRGEND